MNIELIVSKVSMKAPIFEKVIKQINFHHSNEENKVAFLSGTTIFFTDKLFLNFSFDEQLFIIAHEVMHYIRHCMSGQFVGLKNKDNVLLNFVEDAQINQFLLKLGFVPPYGVVLLKDALDYTEEELYNQLFPKIKEIRSWENNVTELENCSSISDILNNTNLEKTNNNKKI